MNRLTMITICVLLFACSHSENLKRKHIVTGPCENEFNNVKLAQGESVWENVSHASGTSASYLITGLGYSTDFIIRFTGGIIGGITVCSPVIALSAMSSSGGSHNSAAGECIGRVGVAAAEVLNPELGAKAYLGTSDWRCPNLDSVVKGLLAVSECYSKKGDKEAAEEQLKRMNSSAIFDRCLSKKMKTKISEALAGSTNKI